MTIVQMDAKPSKKKMPIGDAIKLADDIYIGFISTLGYVQFRSSYAQLQNALSKLSIGGLWALNKSKNNPNPPAEWNLQNYYDGKSDRTILIVDFKRA